MSQRQLNISIASQIDLQTVKDLAYKIWPEAYGEILSAEQISYMLDKIYDLRVLEQQLSDGYLFALATDQERAIGFASWSRLDVKKFKLHKIYLLPSEQGHGYGRQLLRFVIHEITEPEGKSLILNVNRQNPAKHFYEKEGFTVIDEQDIDIGGGYFMNDYIMARAL